MVMTWVYQVYIMNFETMGIPEARYWFRWFAQFTLPNSWVIFIIICMGWI